ncbi:hypothetical protein O3M35_002680 [Rhynocoris fuscipes]|uniref:Uncharacterized protein n=1 Tax=Rhynocoris fuscipes TaxID=488301 RepID=A0AAW1CPM3_9HEMI
MLGDEDSKLVILEAENFGRKVSFWLIFLLASGFPLGAFVIALIGEIMTNFKEKHLLLKIWIPWNRENAWVHVLTNAWLTLLTIACLSIYAAFFVIELTFSLYVSAYIKQLENKLVKNGIKNQEIYEQHKVIMQLIIDYNDVLSGQMYIEAVISPLMPCGFALAAIKMESLHKTSYMTNWYEDEPKIRKDLLTMMTKTTSPTSVNYRLYVKFDHVLLSAVNNFNFTLIDFNHEKEPSIALN